MKSYSRWSMTDIIIAVEARTRGRLQGKEIRRYLFIKLAFKKNDPSCSQCKPNNHWILSLRWSTFKYVTHNASEKNTFKEQNKVDLASFWLHNSITQIPWQQFIKRLLRILWPPPLVWWPKVTLHNRAALQRDSTDRWAQAVNFHLSEAIECVTLGEKAGLRSVLLWSIKFTYNILTRLTEAPNKFPHNKGSSLRTQLWVHKDWAKNMTLLSL